MTTHRPLTDLIGLDPNFTGGLSADEHLRRQRCGECDEALTEVERLRALVGNERYRFDEWGAMPRDEAIRQAHIAQELANNLRAELDALKARLREPAVAAVLELLEDRNRQYYRAEAAHEAKDEANRRWLEVATKR